MFGVHFAIDFQMTVEQKELVPEVIKCENKLDQEKKTTIHLMQKGDLKQLTFQLLGFQLRQLP